MTTIAGGQSGSDDDGVGRSAELIYPVGVAVDATGDAFVTEEARIRRVVLASASVSTIAGEDAHDAAQDGVGGAAGFESIFDGALDSRGDLLVVDQALRAVDLDDGQTTSPTPALGGRAIAVDGSGDVFVAVAIGTAVARIDVATGEATVVAGVEGTTGFADGAGAAALFRQVTGLFADAASHLYAVDQGNCVLRRIDRTTAEVSTVAGAAGQCSVVDGDTSAARLGLPIGITGDSNELYVSDWNCVREMDIATGNVSTFAGTWNRIGDADGQGAAARFAEPAGLALDGAGNLLVADTGNGLIRSVALATGTVSTALGGRGQRGLTLGPFAGARLNQPVSVTPLADGDLVVLDAAEHSVARARY